MTNPTVQIGCVKNVFVRQMHFVSAGDVEQGHAHTYDHMTLLAKGRLRVTVGENSVEYAAPTMIFIKANTQHQLTAITDQTVAYCVHALRDPDTQEIISDEMALQAGNLYRYTQALVIK